MSFEEKGFFERLTSRREFLEFSGKSIAGVTVSLTLLSVLTGCEEETLTEVTGLALATGVLISDPNRCTGCRRCETNCTMNNDGKADPVISRIKVGRNYNYGPNGTGNAANGVIIADTCHQCKHPVPCASACPMSAIYAQEKTGTRVVDEDKCIGCGACTKACPFRMIAVDTEVMKSKKCFLCNGNPACASLCPTGSLKLVPWEEVYTAMARNKHRFA